jgi:hypothetical protein
MDMRCIAVEQAFKISDSGGILDHFIVFWKRLDLTLYICSRLSPIYGICRLVTYCL